MNGLYIHFPFCLSKCAYCGFYSVISKKTYDNFEDFLITEIKQRKNYLENCSIDTIYFGGGTPTLLSANRLDKILNSISSHFNISTDAEITIEANPDTLNKIFIKQLNTIGFNRLSIGIQSFNDNDLKYLGRKHDSKHAIDSIINSYESGFSNINIDFIYNIPTQSFKSLEENLSTAVKLNLAHISAYSLTVEEKTILNNKINNGIIQPVTDNKFKDIFYFIHSYLNDYNYNHYEISNYSLNGKKAKHNLKYWNGTPYMGIGPSAHSYNGITRQWNVSSIEKYINSIQNGSVLFEKEILTDENKYNEIIMTGLRTDSGINSTHILKTFADNEKICNHFIQTLSKQKDKISKNKSGNYIINENLWHICDSIILNFIF